MVKSQKIVAEIVEHVGKDVHSAWYVGIARKAKTRLFEDHRVSEESGRWIYRKGDDDVEARNAEAKLHDQGFDGASGGGDDTTLYVYAYKKTPNTKE